MGHDVDIVLKERGETYGSYSKNAAARADILNILRHVGMARSWSPTVLMGFNDIIMKLVRAANYPEHIDNWVDIQGYAKLIEEDLMPPKGGNPKKGGYK